MDDGDMDRSAGDAGRLRFEDIKACLVSSEPEPGSVHVETPAAIYHYTLEKRIGGGWVMNLHPCDCPSTPENVNPLA